MSYPTVREAKPSDLDAITHLMLTSFRQIPIVDRLYAPLRKNRALAYDTIFFLRRQLKRFILDENARLTIAELPNEDFEGCLLRPVHSELVKDEMKLECWSMLDWVKGAGLKTIDEKHSPGKRTVGYAVWKLRHPHSMGGHAPRYSGLWAKLQVWWMTIEETIYKLIYGRNDMDWPALTAHLESKKQLFKDYYNSATCYHLENLCADFRIPRRGIGSALIEEGIEQARRLTLSHVSVEASPDGIGLYRKLGFQEVGSFSTTLPSGEAISHPVLRLLLESS